MSRIHISVLRHERVPRTYDSGEGQEVTTEPLEIGLVIVTG